MTKEHGFLVKLKKHFTNVLMSVKITALGESLFVCVFPIATTGCAPDSTLSHVGLFPYGDTRLRSY